MTTGTDGGVLSFFNWPGGIFAKAILDKKINRIKIEERTLWQIRNAFVLLPECDSAARTALAAYAEATSNFKTARFIRALLRRIHFDRMSSGQDKRKIVTNESQPMWNRFTRRK